jgi:hypothetical protein
MCWCGFRLIDRLALLPDCAGGLERLRPNAHEGEAWLERLRAPTCTGHLMMLRPVGAAGGVVCRALRVNGCGYV